MTLLEIRNIVVKEANLKGANTETGWINSLVNRKLQSYTALRKYAEFFVPNFAINATAANDPNFVLPTDLQHLNYESVRYSDDGDIENARGIYRGSIGGSAIGLPYRYARIAGNLRLRPTTISATAKVFIDYYSLPTTLSNDADVFPVSGLEDVIINETVSEILLHTNTKLAAVKQQRADSDYSKSRAVDTAP